MITTGKYSHASRNGLRIYNVTDMPLSFDIPEPAAVDAIGNTVQ